MDCIRKVVSFGNSSSCVVIPREYMEWMNIEDGDMIVFNIYEVRKK